MIVNQSCRTRIFISYSHNDREAVERLKIHLASRRFADITDEWDVTRKNSRERGKDRLQLTVGSAKVAILLVSADLLASRLVINEFPRLFAAAEDDGLVVLPVILKPSSFNRIPGLSEFQSVNSEPLLGLSEIEQEKIWNELSLEIEEIIQQPLPERIKSRISSTIRVLLVEDDRSWRKILKDEIERALVGVHINLTIATNFDDGWSALNNEEPWHLMVTDVALPSTDEMLGKLLIKKARKLQILTIVVSGRSTQDDVKEFLEDMGAYCFFEKRNFYKDEYSDLFVSKVKETLDLLPEGKNKEFDVFLSYNSLDQEIVVQLGKTLQRRNLKVWLDKWQLIPGRSWQEDLENIVQTANSAAVLVGSSGLGPWQHREVRACLSAFVDKGLPVIPVLLPGASTKPEVPIFLKLFNWVDLRDGLTVEGLDRLQWGITGMRPGSDRA